MAFLSKAVRLPVTQSFSEARERAVPNVGCTRGHSEGTELGAEDPVPGGRGGQPLHRWVRMEGEVSMSQDEALGLHLGPLRWCYCGTVTGIRSRQNTD